MLEPRAIPSLPLSDPLEGSEAIVVVQGGVVKRSVVSNLVGPQGEQGVQGPPGQDGADGAQGEQGERGLQGEPGADGAPGQDGAPGVDGQDGQQGIQGPPGEQGEQGIQGPQGEPGQSGGEAFPVGSIFISAVATNPNSLLGYGTWSAIGAGRFLVGRDAGDTDFDTLGETGGAKTVTLTEAQIPAHTHVMQRFPTATGGSTGFTVDTSMSGTPAAANVTGSTGGGQAHPNVPPYLVVNFWQRTA